MLTAARYSYKHHSLTGETSTRLLRLAPAKDSAQTLECKLLEISLLDPPHYEAVSYAWGSQTKTSSILCDGHELPITASCDAALRLFRHRSKHRMLWIDSVCINQSRTEERNHQARIMDQVYELAKRVLIYLGEGNSETDHIFTILRDKGAMLSLRNTLLRFETLAYEWDQTLVRARSKFLIESRLQKAMHSLVETRLLGNVGSGLRQLNRYIDSHSVRDVVPKVSVRKTVVQRKLAFSYGGMQVQMPSDDALAQGPQINTRNESARRKLMPHDINLGTMENARRFVDDFMCILWFHRMWTIQEMVLASRCTFYCGSQRVDAAKLLDALSGIAGIAEIAEAYNRAVLRKYGKKSAERIAHVEHLKAISDCLALERALSCHLACRREARRMEARLGAHRSVLARNIVEENLAQLRIKYLIKHTRVSVSEILVKSSLRGATEPRDKIFALYGILKRMDVAMPEPDYDKSVEAVYTEATFVAMKADANLEALLYVTGLPSEYDLPSWVPDWSDRSRPEITNKDHRRHRASANSTPNIFLADERTLAVKGRPVNRIRILSDSYFYRSDDIKTDSQRLDETIKHWTTLFEKHPLYKEYWGELSDVLNYDVAQTSGRILQATLDYIAIASSPKVPDLEKVWQVIPHIEAARRNKEEPAPTLLQFTDIIPWSKDLPRLRAAFEHREHLSRTLSHKSFFFGFDGYFGIASVAVRAGDDIVLLAGFEVPAIVRHVETGPQEKSRSRFISPAYVSDYMAGEGWDRTLAVLNERVYRFT